MLAFAALALGVKLIRVNDTILLPYQGSKSETVCNAVMQSITPEKKSLGDAGCIHQTQEEIR